MILFRFEKRVTVYLTVRAPSFFVFFFLNDPAPTEFSPLPLPDPSPVPRVGDEDVDLARLGDEALRRAVEGEIGDARPVSLAGQRARELGEGIALTRADDDRGPAIGEDRKSTRLNSSHSQISYAVFCLKK